jgi:hypothetical protein
MASLAAAVLQDAFSANDRCLRRGFSRRFLFRTSLGSFFLRFFQCPTRALYTPQELPFPPMSKGVESVTQTFSQPPVSHVRRHLVAFSSAPSTRHVYLPPAFLPASHSSAHGCVSFAPRLCLAPSPALLPRSSLRTDHRPYFYHLTPDTRYVNIMQCVNFIFFLDFSTVICLCKSTLGYHSSARS